ncbi:MAG TPA: hypothetical protein VIJ47_05145, partial [Acidimicrobiales bacterium]
MQPTPQALFSRRTVLLGAAGLAGVGLLAACGSSSSTTTGATELTLTPADGPSTLQAIFDAVNPFVVTGSPQRMAFGVAGPDGSPILAVPASLEFRISRDGRDLGAPLSVAGHHDGVPIGYYPVRTV